MWRMGIAIGAATAALCVTWSYLQPDQSWSGSPRVVDGDTLVTSGGRRIRLWGIDAPEISQTCTNAEKAVYMCGLSAKRHMQELVTGHDVTCVFVSQDRYGRDVARCAADGQDLGSAMVRAGWAIDYRRYSQRTYQLEEIEAQRARRGMHDGTFVTPETYRHQHARSGQ